MLLRSPILDGIPGSSLDPHYRHSDWSLAGIHLLNPESFFNWSRTSRDGKNFLLWVFREFSLQLLNPHFLEPPLILSP